MAWKWYGVKTLYRVSAEGAPDVADERYDPNMELIEERVVLIRARNHEEAHRKALAEAELHCGDGRFPNVFGQTIHTRLLDEQVSFELFEEPAANREVWSNSFLVSKELSDEKIIAMRLLAPETEEEAAKRACFFAGRFPMDDP